MSVACSTVDQLVFISCAPDFSDAILRPGLSIVGQLIVYICECSFLIYHGGFHDLFVCP